MKKANMKLLVLVGGAIGLASVLGLPRPAPAAFLPAPNGLTKTLTSNTTNPLAGSPLGYDITAQTVSCFTGHCDGGTEGTGSSCLGDTECGCAAKSGCCIPSGACSLSPSTPCSQNSDCPAGVCLPGAAVNVQIHDQLPVDQYGNQLMSMVSTACGSNAPYASQPACTGGAAVQGPVGNLTWTFPGNSCSPSQCSAASTNPGAPCTKNSDCPDGSCALAQVTLRAHADVRLYNNIPDGTVICNTATAVDAGQGTAGPSDACTTVNSTGLSCVKGAYGGDPTGLGTCVNAPTPTACAFNSDCTVCNGGACLDNNTSCTTAADCAAAGLACQYSNPVAPGTILTYKITVTNNGDETAWGVVISDPVPTQLAFQPGSPLPARLSDPGGDCTTCGASTDNTTCLGGTNAGASCTTDADCPGGACRTNVTVQWQYPYILSHDSRTVSFKAIVPFGLPENTLLFNPATVEDSGGHVDTCTNQLVTSGSCLTITKKVYDCQHKQPPFGCGGECFGATPGGWNANVIPGRTDVITYQLAVTNNSFNSGCTTALSVEARDFLPNGTTYLDCGNNLCLGSGTPFGCCTGPGHGNCPSCGARGYIVGFDVGDLPTIGDDISPTQDQLFYQVMVNANDWDGYQLSNQAYVSALNGAEIGPASLNLTVEGPDLYLQKLNSPNPVEPGGTIDYSFVLTNPSPNCAPQISLADMLPTNASYVLGSEQKTFSGCGSNPQAQFIYPNNVATLLIVPKFNLPSGSSCTGDFQMTVPEGTQLGSTVVNNISATDSIYRSLPAPQPAPPQDNAQAQAIDTVNTRLLQLHKDITGCSCVAGAPGCSYIPSPSVTPTPTPTGGPAMAGTPAPVWVACPLNNPPAGAILDYTLTVQAGPYVATDVVVSDYLPPPNPVPVPGNANQLSGGARFYSTDCPLWNLVGSVLTCNLGNIPANQPVSFQVKIQINPTNQPGTLITNLAAATDDELDSLNASNQVTDSVNAVVENPAPVATPTVPPAPSASPTVTPIPPASGPAPSLQVTVTGTRAVRVGLHVAYVEYWVKVKNTGNAIADNVTLTNVAPSALRVLRGSRRCTVNPAAGSTSCRLGNLRPGQRASVVIITALTSVAHAGDVINQTATAGCDEGSTASGTWATKVVPRR